MQGEDVPRHEAREIDRDQIIAENNLTIDPCLFFFVRFLNLNSAFNNSLKLA